MNNGARYEPFNGVNDIDNTVDAINASIASGTPPSAANKFVTLAEIGATAVPEVLFTADVVATRVGLGAMLPIYTINYPINPLVIDGKSRYLRYVANYSKTTGNTSTAFQIVIGGIILLFPATSMGNTAITNQTYLIEVYLNFRSANQIHAMAFLRRLGPTGNPIDNLVQKTVALGTWNKTIANNISLEYQVVTGTATHTVTLQQVMSQLT